MTDSSLDMSHASLVSPSQQLDDSQHTTDNNSVFSSLPSLPSLPSINIDTRPIQHDSSPLLHPSQPSSCNKNDSTPNELLLSPPHAPTTTDPPSSSDKETDSNGQRLPLRQLMWGHVESFSSFVGRFMFKDNNLPLILNVLGHLMAARQLWGKSNVSVARYTNLQQSGSTTTTATNRLLMADQFQSTGVLHLALGLLAALALKERRLSTERTALWVLSVAAWCQSYVQMKAYLQTPTLYTLKALQEWGGLNGFLTLITTIALRNTIRRTGRLV